MALSFLYSVLHFFVDGVCALAMMSSFIFRPTGFYDVLFYNFCAFALQMPFGIVIDLRLKGRKSEYVPLFAAVLGMALTLLGAFTSPVILGIGNALFHIGGGVGTINEDLERGWKGKALGLFVAPGAFGLYLGSIIGKGLPKALLIRYSAAIGILMGLFSIIIYGFFRRRELVDAKRENVRQEESAIHGGIKPHLGEASSIGEALSGEILSSGQISRDIFLSKKTDSLSAIAIAGLCSIVVVFRSYLGLTVSFPWKTGFLFGILSVLCVVLGKILGGFFAADFGMKRTVCVSLILSSLCYLMSEIAVFGLLGLLCFNMTMPITLCLLIREKPELKGFFFGLLTFALFLGFLPVHFRLPLPFSGGVTGAIISLISLALLAAAMNQKKRSL